MPLYDYECPKCKEVFEELVSGTSDTVDECVCPKCGATAKRVTAPEGTHFGLKGYGWSPDGYRTPKVSPTKQNTVFK